jgi:hypothetical protein
MVLIDFRIANGSKRPIGARDSGLSAGIDELIRSANINELFDRYATGKYGPGPGPVVATASEARRHAS